jgi:hypothetical protein
MITTVSKRQAKAHLEAEQNSTGYMLESNAKGIPFSQELTSMALLYELHHDSIMLVLTRSTRMGIDNAQPRAVFNV